MSDGRKRARMIVDLPPEVQMAIRLRAVKNGVTTGAVVQEAVEKCYPAEMKEAKEAIGE